VRFKYSLGEYYEFNTAVITGLSYYQDSQESMRINTNALRGDTAKINSIENATLAGKPAYKVDSIVKPDPDIATDIQLHKSINYYMVDAENQTRYTLLFRVGEEDYNSYQPIIQRMVESFRIQ
jgi:PsbP